MEKLIKSQNETLGLMSRFWDNTLKVGKDKQTKAYFKARITVLDGYWRTFTSNHQEIIGDDKAPATDYYKSDKYSEAESIYTITRSMLSTETDSAANSTRAEGNHNDGNEPSTLSLMQQMLVPKAEMPKFSGNQRDWEGFRDLYLSLVHNIQGVAASHKMQLLRASLTGDAARCIVGFESTEAGYISAWETLISSYDNKRDLLTFHIRAILRLPTITKPSAAAVKNIVSTVKQAIRAFQNLNRPVQHWDDWFVVVVLEKLDSVSKMLWESKLKSKNDFPTFDKMLEFLQTRARALTAAKADESNNQPSSSNPKVDSPSNSRNKVNSFSTSLENKNKNKSSCVLCKQSHSVAQCKKFKSCNAQQRFNLLQGKGVCYNCLRQGHMAPTCPSSGRCQVCHAKHHTLLHTSNDSGKTQSCELNKEISTGNQADALAFSNSSSISSNVIALSNSTCKTILLATARIYLENPHGHRIIVRALLDSGSEASFITERAVQQLRLTKHKIYVPVSGLQGTVTGNANATVSVLIRSHDLKTAQIPISKVLVLSSLTTLSPPKKISGDWPHLIGLDLADPSFNQSAPIDMIIGADVYGSLLRGGIIQGPLGAPSAHCTVLGWVLMGAVTSTENNTSTQETITSLHTLTLPDLHKQVQLLWSEGEIQENVILTPEEEYCEQHFQSSHTRDSDGRYVVRLPIRKGFLEKLGASRPLAVKQFQSLETRFSRNNVLKEKYCQFMDDYQRQGHMRKTSSSHETKRSYFLPHHAVVKKADESKKIRVVFNASASTTSGYSLNDCLLPGPKLHEDLWQIIARWRMFKFVFTTDMVQMFRQIKIHPEDQSLQNIVWRENTSDKLHDFSLTTVTYGTVSAPFLANRTIKQLATDEQERFPLGAAALRRNVYVDDILAGGDSISEAMEMRSQLTEIMAAGGFGLSKWAANRPELCPDEESSTRLFSDSLGVQTLGLLWSASSDVFHLRVLSDCCMSKCTRRSVLSDVAKLFDPLGWAAPVLITGKVFIQDLWKTKLTWDEPLPETLQTQWLSFARSLSDLNKISVPRYVHSSASCARLSLIGFSDASERAYGAVVYLRCEYGDSVKVSLLISKTRVSPIKTTSIPRLELCGALLLAKLMNATAKGLDLSHVSWHLWTDAKVVLHWLSAHPSRWQPYVAHRVAKIQEIVKESECWNHVSTHSNPADLCTRGIKPIDLAGNNLWWHGPSWLTQPFSEWPKLDLSQESYEDQETRLNFNCHTQTYVDNELLLRFSSYTRLLRVTALCLRFIKNLRDAENRAVGCLTLGEIRGAGQRWLRLSQQQDFQHEISLLKRGKCLPGNSPLSRLRPFISEDDILRVGGRIHQSHLSEEGRHPPILSKHSHLSLLITRRAHSLSLHGGPQLMRATLVNFWIIRGTDLAKRVARGCVSCVRFRATTGQQQMGQLPPERIQRSRPFSNSGVDFAGPFSVTTFRGRGYKAHKTYVALFICLSTKSVHIELVCDLTSNAFIAAFKRFTARRGHCTRLFSDNATNFRGADVELRRMWREATDFYKEVSTELVNLNTIWRFIPPSAPHFGGIWEAGVKSVKFHLRRVVGDQVLSHEEMITLLCQIESCLNSRPLCPLSDDPNDFHALTPSHFLVGEPLINIPERQYEDVELHPLARWQLVSRLRDHVWKRWSTEYLQRLQSLQKWTKGTANIDVGRLVLIKSDLQPPAKWQLGRVMATHPGPDQRVRVVTVKTANNILKRPIHKLCPLPDNKIVPESS